MAKYSIVHTCGHEETVQIYGTNVHGERTRKAEWLESKPCRNCEREALREDMLAGAAELNGSDKQVAWANDLRDKAIKEARELLAKLEADTRVSQADKNTWRANGENAIKAMLAETSAREIIDHRDDLVRQYNKIAQRPEAK